MDPLSAIFESLSNIFGFSPLFLTFTLVIGYLLFFTFFFNSDYWKKLGTADRFFFGFILGVVLISVLTLVSFPIAFFAYSFFGNVITIGAFSYGTIESVFYLLPICFLAFIILFRLKIKKPLVSKEAYEQLFSFLQNHRSYWMYLFLIGSIILYVYVGWNNPFISNATVSLWRSAILLLNYSIFLGYFVILFIVSFLCHFEASTSYREMVDTIFVFCFPIPFKKSSNVPVAPEEVRSNRLRFLYTKGSKFLKNIITNSFLRRVILVVFFSFIIILAEGTLNIFSPTVGLIETEQDFSRVEVYNNLKGSTVYTVDTVQTYWINLPAYSINNINLSIVNPSNFSLYDATQSGTWERRLYSVELENDPKLAITPKTNNQGEIEYIDVKLLNSTPIETIPYVRLSYKDQLDLDLIETIGPYETDLGNGSIVVSLSLIINNPMDRTLASSDYALFETEKYGNITSFVRLNNRTELASPWFINENGWLWTAFSLKSHTSLNMTITCVFEELIL